MMSGQTKYHEQLENELAAFVMKESTYLWILDTELCHNDTLVTKMMWLYMM
jgi:7-keto-8-aminopelargonate synthetase-like enzyme